MAERVNLEYLDRICDALDCNLSDIIIRVPNIDSEVRHRSRRGESDLP